MGALDCHSPYHEPGGDSRLLQYLDLQHNKNHPRHAKIYKNKTFFVFRLLTTIGSAGNNTVKIG